MKNILKLFLCAIQMLLLAFCLSSCGNNDDSKDEVKDEDITNNDKDGSTVIEEKKYLAIHYYRFDHEYTNWGLWLWKDGGAGTEYSFDQAEDGYGAVGTFDLSTWPGILQSRLGFIIKSKGNWDNKDVDGDRFVSISTLTMDSNNTYHMYLKTKDETIYKNIGDVSMVDILSCEFKDLNIIEFEVTSDIVSFKVYENNNLLETIIGEDNKTKYSYELGSMDLSNSYKVEATFKDGDNACKAVSVNSLFTTDYFTEAYTYTSDDLGVSYKTNKTVFKVWSPTSSLVKLRVYSTGTPLSIDSTNGSDTPIYEYDMIKGQKGVWEKEVSGDLEGKYYTYVVTNAKFTNKEIVDPYAKSAGVNGLRGMIVDFSKTNPTGWDKVSPYAYKTTELVIYETHVSDITSSSTWSTDEEALRYAKTFTAATISGTKYQSNELSVSTGFDHIKELGVNAVQLLPIFDQANDEVNLTFNWGYNPLNYNVLEGGYSTNPYDGYTRIVEFKKLVQAYNEAGINIIMDVVYNHVNEASGSNFDVLVPGYYFRYTNGTLSNGSGCGNETASEMPMFRKFMIDSTAFLASEYKLGGFRFDLMAVHDITTMNQIASSLKEINPTISIFGEPWTGGTSALPSNLSASQANGNSYVGYGQFNDQYRDSLIKGGMKAHTELGYVNTKFKTYSAELAQITGGIKGFTVQSGGSGIYDPLKTLNYVTCHDNYTLVDRLKATGETKEDIIKKQAMLANSMVLTSQGATLILAGEEFMRTKNGDDNSYKSSYKVNELDYSLKIKNLNYFNNYKALINLKTTASGLQLTTKEECNLIDIKASANQISYKITDTKNNKEYYIIHNNGYDVDNLGSLDLSSYTLYLDTLNSNITLEANTSFSAYQTIIAYKNL